MLRLEHDVPLAPRTTLGLGGPARRFARVTTEQELLEAVGSEPRILVLGGGSNLVVGDGGWDGLVVQIDLPGIHVVRREDHAVVAAGAGVEWDAFVKQMVDGELVGVECLAGIPGLVGATPIQNVGAYGQEVADTISAVRVLDRATMKIETLPPEACGFAYRTSRFKGVDRWIVLEVQFRFAMGTESAPLRYPELTKALGAERAPLTRVRETVIALRRGKGMVVDPADPDSRSAGSFFTNPLVDADTVAALDARFGSAMPRWPAAEGRTKLSAGWLIERAGFAKGTVRGNVGLSTKHALALINRGGATTAELLAFAREIQDGVRAQLGVDLHPEPEIV